MQWWVYVLIALIGAGLGFLILSMTPWYRVRKYAMDIKKIYDRHKLQERAEAVQALGQNPNANPVLMRKPLRELTATYEALIADMNKMKVPKKARTMHELSVSVAKESLAMYQMAAVGGFRQKSIMEKQKKVQKMQEQLQAEMERIYGPMKK
ncbi:MAG: hypothetical protein ACOY93_02725 [Bacillota bacterium]